jgi:hypothetical protein
MIVEIMNRIVEQEENIGLRPHFPQKKADALGGSD